MKPVCTLLSSIFVFAGLAVGSAQAALWQYSTTIDSIASGEIHGHPRAYLWIPPKCKRVRAVVVAQHNLLEESILTDSRFRQALDELGFAEVWIMPNLDYVFDFKKGAGDAFDEMMKGLASTSGYGELAYAPIVPLGHSAAASYPWNFAGWAPQRTLAILSVHGDSPLSNRTGSGRPNPDWGANTLDGIPGLVAVGQFEWGDFRIQPALDYVAKHPASPVAMLPDLGDGHFDTSPRQIEFLSMFLRKAAHSRLPASLPLDGPSILKPVDPKDGWLVERWSETSPRRFPAAPYNQYAGDGANAFWCFDREMAMATEDYAHGRTLDKNKSIVYVQSGKVLTSAGGAAGWMPRPKPETDNDGRTFHFSAYVVNGTIAPGTDWNDALAATVGAKPLMPRVLCGPIARIDDSTYRLEFDQSGFDSAYRSYNAFVSTIVPETEPELVRPQPAGVFLPHNTAGSDNTISFPPLADVTNSRKPVSLAATSASGMPVAYYVDSGPAVVEGNTLRFTPIPPRSKFPVGVRVVAWQWGRSSTPQVKSADPVTVTFNIIK